MQQLCLTGPQAPALANRLFNALNVRPAGLCIAPFTVDGEIRGEALHLLPPPAPPLYNGVPCRIALSEEQSVPVHAALEKLAAPGLRSAMRMLSPLLISGLTAGMLDCEAFLLAVQDCLTSPHPVVVAADAAAAERLRGLVPPEGLLVFDVPEDPTAQAALLEALIPEAALRF